MTEVNAFTGMDAKEIGALAGVVPTERISADHVDTRIVVGVDPVTGRSFENKIEPKGGVFAARFAATDKDQTHQDMINQDRLKVNKDRELLHQQPLELVGADSLLENLKAEELKMIKGEKSSDKNVREFLGKPIAVDAAGAVTEAPTGSFAKLERLKGEAATSYAELEELVTKLKGESLAEVKARVDKFNGFDAQMAVDKDKLNFKILKEIIEEHSGESRVKMLGSLGIYEKDFVVQTDDKNDVTNIDELRAIVAGALELKVDERVKSEGTVGGWAKNLFRSKAEEAVTVDNFIKLGVAHDKSTKLHKAEAETFGADYAQFGSEYKNFTKKLTMVANREKVNAEISGAVDKGLRAKKIQQEIKWGNEARAELNTRVAKAEELVAIKGNVEQLDKLAKKQAQVIEVSLSTMGAIKKLDEQKAAAGETIAEGNVPERLGEIIGAESFKSVDQFIATGGKKGDIAAVEMLLQQMEELVKDKLPSTDGEPVLRAEFLSSNTIVIGDKQVELGMVVGVTEDPDVIQISLAQRVPGSTDIKEIQVDNDSSIFFPHAEVRRILNDVRSLEDSISALENSKVSTIGKKGIAGTTSYGEQHEEIKARKTELLSDKKKMLADTKAILSTTLKPMGGDGETLSKVLTQMGEGQQQIVEDLYSGEYNDSVVEMAKLLNVTPESVTPAMLAVTHVEALQVAEHTSEILSYFNNFGELKSEAIHKHNGDMMDLSHSLADLREIEKYVATIPATQSAVRAQTEKSIERARANIDKKAKRLAAKIQQSLLKVTPEILQIDAREIKSTLKSAEVAKQATALLKKHGLSEKYGRNVGGVVSKSKAAGGLSQELEHNVKQIRNVLSVTDTPISESLMSAFNGGDTFAMERVVNEVMDAELKLENEKRDKVERIAREGLKLEEMTGVQLAEAFVSTDIEQDAKLKALMSLEQKDMIAGLERMVEIAKNSTDDNPSGGLAMEDFMARVLESVQIAENTGTDDTAMINLLSANPENWKALMVFATNTPGTGIRRSTFNYAIQVADKLIEEEEDEKKN